MVVADVAASDLVEDIVQHVAISHLSEDVDVVLTHVVAVVGVAFELIQMFSTGRDTCTRLSVADSCMFPCRSDYIITISGAFRFEPLGPTLLSSACAAFR